jgi:hypothetical protein
MAKWGKLLRLTRSKRYLLFKACLLLTSIRLGLGLLPFQVLMRVVGAACKSNIQSILPSSSPIESVVWAVEGISRHMPGHTKCLARALTTKVLLHQQGYASNLQIGVAKSDNGSLEAHAWIEYEGRIVIGNLRDLSRFIPLPSVEGVKL